MKNLQNICELRPCGFYELKQLLGLGDENLKMLLAVAELQPIKFKTGEKYLLFAVREALNRLQGCDIQFEYETMRAREEAEATMDPETLAKLHKVQLRLLKRKRIAQ